MPSKEDEIRSVKRLPSKNAAFNFGGNKAASAHRKFAEQVSEHWGTGYQIAESVSYLCLLSWLSLCLSNQNQCCPGTFRSWSFSTKFPTFITNGQKM